MKRFIVAFAALFCTFVLVPPFANAAPFYVEDGSVYGHKGPDGTISFFAKDTAAKWSIQIHKVFSAEDKVYYFLKAGLSDKNFATQMLPDLVLTLNKQDFLLKPLDGKEPHINKNYFSGWYALPEEAVQLLAKADTMALNLQYAGVPPKTWKPFPSKLAGFRQLPALEKTAYIREGVILQPEREPEKTIFHPQLFIPGVTPAEVIDALIYEANFNTYKGKETFDYSSGYFVYRTTDPQVVQLLCRQGLSNAADFVTVACRPYKNGVWVTLSLMAERYSYGYHYSFYEDTPSGSFIATQGYWRTNSRLWGRKLHSIYANFYGNHDYGFSYDWQDRKRGPFAIRTVNLQKFPELEGVKAGDLLTAVDGAATALMGPLDLEYFLDDGIGGPKTFTFKTAGGEEKKVTIIPQVQFAKPEGRKDYNKILAEKMPKWFWKKEINSIVPGDGQFLDSDLYHPWGTELK